MCVIIPAASSKLLPISNIFLLIFNSLILCSVLEQLGGKQIVMQHLGHEDPNVRYEALLAVQKLMVHNWLVKL